MKRPAAFTVSALALALASFATKPQFIEFPATVTEVVDGDTVTIRKPCGLTERIRFAHCDAPEMSQPFGKQSKQFVEKACLNKRITVRTTGERDNTPGKRLIAEIILPGRKSLNRELVRQGLAWWFYHYSKDRSVGALEAEAKAAQRGLFSSATPIYPRNWRRGTRVSSTSKSPGVFIMALFPNPAGEEAGNEAVILANGTAEDISIDEWTISDDDGWSLRLSGIIPAGSTRTIKQLSHKSVLGNRGDVVRLINPKGKIVQTVSYENARPGAFVMAR